MLDLDSFLRGRGLNCPDFVLSFRLDSEDWHAGFSASQYPDLLGMTTYAENDRSLATVEVALGIPRIELMATLAHEVGHVLLASYEKALDLPQHIQEGVCECIAEAYVLTDQDAYGVRRFRARLRGRTDPIYGRGYAIVSDEVDRIGLKATIEEICQ